MKFLSTNEMDLPELPLSKYRDEYLTRLNSSPTLLLDAEPGAGKSTLAPLWTLSLAPEGQVVWLVQPRILAARSLAGRLAELLGEKPGKTIGYQLPYDTCLNAANRLVLMTPGILLQQLLYNPTLEGVATVILDEIHERGLNQDTAWAWLQEVQIVREDLRTVLMSATPDPVLQRQITNKITASGRCFPVHTIFQPAKQMANQWDEKIDQQLLRALKNFPDWQEATVLVFLPGWRDIENCAQSLRLYFPTHTILRLHSRVSPAEQLKVLDPAQGPRIILSTNIAETSLTIADVTLVIDSGLVRRADYEQRTGLSRLRTVRISQASADQRRGRAGRVQAGTCIRLWSQDQPLAAAELPEIRSTDYLPFALRLAHWGSPVQELNWLEAPNQLALLHARQQLKTWQLLTHEEKITPLGQQVSELGTHPRIAVLLQASRDLAQQKISSANLLLALALHFELSVETDAEKNWMDMHLWLDHAANELKRNSQWRQQRQRWLSLLKVTENSNIELNEKCLSLAFNDRIGFRQESGRYRLNSGISIEPLHRLDSQWAVFPYIQVRHKGHSGMGIALNLHEEEFKKLGQLKTRILFKNNRWQREQQWMMGGVILAEQNHHLPPENIASELLTYIQALLTGQDLEKMIDNAEAKQLLQRARVIAHHQLLELPPADNHSLCTSISEWLQPFLNAQTRPDHWPWLAGLEFYFGYDVLKKMDEIFPKKIQLPSGRLVALDFSAENIPELSGKLQEFFGCEQLQLAKGKIPLRIHLLSPNGSPLAITTDLDSFWRQAYPQVRKEMRGRYPRHPWPENPWEHPATALTKKRLLNKPGV